MNNDELQVLLTLLTPTAENINQIIKDVNQLLDGKVKVNIDITLPSNVSANLDKLVQQIDSLNSVAQSIVGTMEKTNEEIVAIENESIVKIEAINSERVQNEELTAAQIEKIRLESELTQEQIITEGLRQQKASQVESYTEDESALQGHLNNFKNLIEHHLAWLGSAAVMYGGFTLFNEGIVQIDSGMAGLKQTLESTYAEMGKTLDQKTMADISNQFMDIAKQYGESMGDLLSGAKLVSRQYKDMGEIMAFVRAGTKLQIIDNMNLVDSFKALESITNQFGMVAKNGAEAELYTSEITDKLSNVVHNAAISAQDLTDGLQRSGSILSEMGVDLDHAIGLITAGVRATQLSGSQIGMALKSVAGSIKSAAGVKELEKLDISVKDAEGNFRSLTAILEDLMIKSAGSAKSLDEVDKAISGGKFQFSKVMATLSDYSTYVQTVALSINSAGASHKFLAAQMDTIVKRAELLKEQLVGLVNSAGEGGLTGVIKGLLWGLTELIKDLNSMSGFNLALVGSTAALITVGLKWNSIMEVSNKLYTTGANLLNAMGIPIAQVTAAKEAQAIATMNVASAERALAVVNATETATEEQLAVASAELTVAREAQMAADYDLTAAQDTMNASMGNFLPLIATAIAAAVGISIASQMHTDELNKQAEATKNLQDAENKELDAKMNSFDIDKQQLENDQKQSQFLADMAQKHAQLTEALSHTSKGTKEYQQLSEDLTATEKAATLAMDGEASQRLKLAGFTQEAFNTEKQALADKITNDQANYTKSLEEAKTYTENQIKATYDRIEAIKAESLAQKMLSETQVKTLNSQADEALINAGLYRSNGNQKKAKELDDYAAKLHRQAFDIARNDIANELDAQESHLNDLLGKAATLASSVDAGNVGITPDLAPLDDGSPSSKSSTSTPSILSPTDALISQIDSTSQLTDAQNKQIQSQIQTAQSNKDFATELTETNSLISGQSKEITQLTQANTQLKSKIDALGHADWIDASGNQTLKYVTDYNALIKQNTTSSKAQASQMSQTFTELQKYQKALDTNNTSIQTLTTSNASLKQSLQTLQFDIVTAQIQKFTDAITESNAQLDLSKARQALTTSGSADYNTELTNQVKIYENLITQEKQSISYMQQELTNTNLNADAKKQLTTQIEEATKAELGYQYAIQQQSQTLATDVINAEKSLAQAKLDSEQKELTDFQNAHQKIIASYQAQLDALQQVDTANQELIDEGQKLNAIATAQLSLQQAQAELQNAQNEKNTRILVGNTWTWEANPNTVNSAIQKVTDAQTALMKAQDDYNTWETQTQQKHEEQQLQDQIKSENTLISDKQKWFNGLQSDFDNEWKDINGLSQKYLDSFNGNIDKAITTMSQKLATLNAQLAQMAKDNAQLTDNIGNGTAPTNPTPPSPTATSGSIKMETHDTGGVVGGTTSNYTTVSLADIASGKILSNGEKPILAKPGELILNQLQQSNLYNGFQSLLSRFQMPIISNVGSGTTTNDNRIIIQNMSVQSPNANNLVSQLRNLTYLTNTQYK